MRDLSEWTQGAVTRIRSARAPHHVDTQHVDALGLPWSGIESVSDVLAPLLHEAQGLPAGCRIALALPLAESEALPSERPDLDALVLDDVEPPSVYVFGDAHFALGPDTSDRLHLPYPSTPWGSTGTVHVELVARRDRLAADEGWGWTSTLWIHMLPART
ncbi:hypothetical protein [Oerskovia turbata]